jgi:FkbM family methyltransferase
MRDTLIRLARAVGKMTPSSTLRLWMINAYFKAVQGNRTVATRGGITYDLDLSETIDALVRVGAFECDVQNAIVSLYKPGTIALDIGANIGAHALPLGRLAGTLGEVYAFEPTTYAFNKLTTNIALNPTVNVKAFRLALSDTNKTNATINFRSSWRTDGSRADSSCVVDFVKLDDWLLANQIRGPIAFIKIDVDGNEYSIISGGRNMLIRDRPTIVMEAVGPHFANDETNPILWLWREGWKFYALKSNRAYKSIEEIRCQLPANDPGMTKSINLIARYNQYKGSQE